LTGIYKEASPEKDASKLRAHLNELEEDFQKAIYTNGMEFKFTKGDAEFFQRLDYANNKTPGKKKLKKGSDICSWILNVWNENRGDGLWYKPPMTSRRDCGEGRLSHGVDTPINISTKRLRRSIPVLICSTKRHVLTKRCAEDPIFT